MFTNLPNIHLYQFDVVCLIFSVLKNMRWNKTGLKYCCNDEYVYIIYMLQDQK